MNATVGWTLSIAGMLMLAATWVWLQHRVSQAAADALTVGSAAIAALGGLLVLTDVTLASWVLAPVLAGGGAWLHRRVLWHGAGPLRT